MSEVLEAPRREELLSVDAFLLAAQATGGPAGWFLWHPGSGQDSIRLAAGLVQGWGPISVSTPGRSIEFDTRLFEEAAKRWRGIRRPTETPKQRRTPLGRRLAELRERIEASGQPLLSWNDIDRELAELRGERP